MGKDFRRKIEDRITEYFRDQDAEVLLIDGARQIGKSYVIRKMGRSAFRHYVEINLISDRKEGHFFDKVDSKSDFYFALQSFTGGELGDRNDTLIFIDEIQEQPEIITLLKFLREDGKYRYIASGSLLGVAIRKTSSIPVGNISVERMYPMDLTEFAWAKGFDDEMLSQLKKSIFEEKDVSETVHGVMMSLFREYLVCGGLPECVDIFLTEQNIIKLRNKQLEIHGQYADDASKYDSANKLHTKEIFDLVPSTVENKKRRIRAKDIEGKGPARFESYKEDFDDLINSRVVLRVTSCANPTFRLIETAKRNLLKLYLADVGILTGILYKYNVLPLLHGTGVNLGNVYETFVAGQLSALGHELYYCDNKKLGEIDYLIDDYDTLSVVPIEVKSGNDYKTHKGLDNLLETDGRIMRGYVLCDEREIVTDGRITYLPIYSVMFLRNRWDCGRHAVLTPVNL